MKRLIFLLLLSIIIAFPARSSYLLIPMDDSQQNHLKAYGIAYWILTYEIEVSWLLNYRGGSFMVKYSKSFQDECSIRGVTYEIIADVQATAILQQIADPEANMDEVKLVKAPKIAVYSPPNKLPWDDAVTLVLTYAEIPYTIVYDEEVLTGVLPKYDWLHMHHEDFTGQYGKFYGAFRNAAWYQEDVHLQEEIARKLGYSKVSQLKLAVVKKIRDFVAGGGYLFAMCSAPDSFDIALSADGVDICDVPFDGDPPDPHAQSKLDYSQCFAFTNFTINTDPYQYNISNIDVTYSRGYVDKKNDFFTLFDFSAKWDQVPTMLCQDHKQIIKAFMGQTTAFNKNYVKSSALIMGENKSLNEAKYIHGEYGKGMWTFLGGHDPEDYQHLVYSPPTDLNLYPTSPGYRLILNNVLFPAARKKKQKT